MSCDVSCISLTALCFGGNAQPYFPSGADRAVLRVQDEIEVLSDVNALKIGIQIRNADLIITNR